MRLSFPHTGYSEGAGAELGEQGSWATIPLTLLEVGRRGKLQKALRHWPSVVNLFPGRKVSLRGCSRTCGTQKSYSHLVDYYSPLGSQELILRETYSRSKPEYCLNQEFWEGHNDMEIQWIVYGEFCAVVCSSAFHIF